MQLPSTTQRHPFMSDFSLYLPAMPILDGILKEIAGKQDAISIGIRLAVERNTAALHIIRWIKEMATDNRAMVEGLIGKVLTDKCMGL